MTFYLNELSLHNQFHSQEHFLNSIRLFWNCKELLRRYHFGLNCSRLALGNRPVINSLNFRSSIGNLQNRDLQRIILRWIDQEGPFWDDDQVRVHSPDDYFSNEAEEIVTDTALAEAAYLSWKGRSSAVVSLNPSSYLTTPIKITWYKSEEKKNDITINNYWETVELEKLLVTLVPPIQSWHQLILRITSDFSNLTFLPGLEHCLQGQPFNTTIATHVIELLSILNKFKGCFEENGERSTKGHEIYNEFFTGEKAKFTDESVTNKRKFKKDLTFLDSNGNEIFCPYHGKISYQSYRIHFSWPITKDGNVYIAYIGPKITKE
jgi:hypothetical protein